MKIPSGFRVIAEDELLALEGRLAAHCDQCDGITCTEEEFAESAGCVGCSDTDDPVGCCRGCQVWKTRGDLQVFLHHGENLPQREAKRGEG